MAGPRLRSKKANLEKQGSSYSCDIVRRGLCGPVLIPWPQLLSQWPKGPPGEPHPHNAHACYTLHPVVPGCPMVGTVDATRVYHWTHRVLAIWGRRGAKAEYAGWYFWVCVPVFPLGRGGGGADRASPWACAVATHLCCNHPQVGVCEAT